MDKVVFAKANSDDSGAGVGNAGEAGIVGGIFGFVDNVSSEEVAFVICAFGGRVATNTITDGVDVFSGSLEGFVYFDAGGGVFDFGVFETKVGVGLAAGGEYDAIYADHFFGVVTLKDDTFGGVVLLQSDDFAVGEYHDTEIIGEIIGNGSADFFVFAREDATGLFHNDGFGAELGIIFGDLAAGGAAANDKYGLG